MRCLNDMHDWTSSTRRSSEGPGPSSKGGSYCDLCQELGAHLCNVIPSSANKTTRTEGKGEQAAEGMCRPGSFADHMPQAAHSTSLSRAAHLL